MSYITVAGDFSVNYNWSILELYSYITFITGVFFDYSLAIEL